MGLRNFKNIKNFFRKSARFGIFLPITNILNIYFSRIMPKWLLGKIITKRHKIAEQIIEQIVNPEIWDMHPEVIDQKDANTIWVLWLQGNDNMPTIPRLCLKSIKKYNNDKQVVLLTEDNLSKYINLPSYIIDLYKNGSITPTHLSDIIRMGVLSKHGGFWMDATMLFMSPLLQNLDDTTLYTLKELPKGTYVSKCRWAGFFMYSNGSALPTIIYNVFLDYWKKERTILDYFFIDYAIDIAYRKNQHVREEIDSVPFNNPNVHCLNGLLTSTYNKDTLKKLLVDTSCFKLSWKSYTDNKLNLNSNNFFHHIEEFINESESFQDI